MATSNRIFSVIFAAGLAILFASCAHIRGKTVARKDGPNILVATDGSICIVSQERFDKTEVGMKVLCGWRGAGIPAQPTLR